MARIVHVDFREVKPGSWHVFALNATKGWRVSPADHGDVGRAMRRGTPRVFTHDQLPGRR